MSTPEDVAVDETDDEDEDETEVEITITGTGLTIDEARQAILDALGEGGTR